MPAESRLGESLAGLARFFVSDSTMHETLVRVAELCQQALPTSCFVGITLQIEGRPRTAVYTDLTSSEIDQAQYDTGEGPCVDAFRHNQVYRIDSTRADGPWPRFRSAAAAHGVLSTLSVPLSMGCRAVGALNLYSAQEAGFSERDEQVALQFAAHAAVVLANADAYWDARELTERLDQSMRARAVIEQAKGMLMSAQRCNADQAFDILVKASQRENVKLRDVAQRLVTSNATREPDASPS